MWNSSINSTLEVEFVSQVGRGEWIGERDGRRYRGSARRLFGRRNRRIRGGREGADGRGRRVWEYPLGQG